MRSKFEIIRNNKKAKTNSDCFHKWHSLALEELQSKGIFVLRLFGRHKKIQIQLDVQDMPISLKVKIKYFINRSRMFFKNDPFNIWGDRQNQLWIFHYKFQENYEYLRYQIMLNKKLHYTSIVGYCNCKIKLEKIFVKKYSWKNFDSVCERSLKCSTHGLYFLVYFLL